MVISRKRCEMIRDIRQARTQTVMRFPKYLVTESAAYSNFIAKLNNWRFLRFITRHRMSSRWTKPFVEPLRPADGLYVTFRGENV